ncbi:MAG: hypothetical protein QM726_13090 [Chitinophagaceae bacterium]
MKKWILLAAVLFSAVLSGCDGSKTYRGDWKAISVNGDRFNINFDAKTFTVKDSTGAAEHYDYTQNSVSIENSVSTYGIQLKDGRGYKVTFPNSDNKDVGIIKDANGVLMFTISRHAYVRYEDIYKLK